MHRPVIYISQILRWADEFQRKTRRWPMAQDRRIPGQDGLTWCAVNLALRKGNRGLPGGSFVAQLLAEERGVRNRMRLAKLTIRRILDWAVAHQRRTGRWPTP